MDANAIPAVLLGLFLRLGLPLLATALLVYGLRKLDMRWQKEAEEERSLLIREEEPCWMEQGLPIEEIKARAAASGKPCWQIHRLSNGYLREACLGCEVFLDAPAPALEHSNAHA
jgi:predicted nucleic acid-binding protein